MNTIDKIRAEIERRIKESNNDINIGAIESLTINKSLRSLLSFLDALQEPENPKGLQSLINEASETAQRIIDRHSFYASLPENLRHKYTEGSWFEILDAISKYGKQEQEVDLEKEIDKFYGVVRKNGKAYDENDGEFCFDPKDDETYEHELRFARHFYELGKNQYQFKGPRSFS